MTPKRRPSSFLLCLLLAGIAVAFATGRPAQGKGRPAAAAPRCSPVVLAGALVAVSDAEVSLTVRNANVFGRPLVGAQVRVARDAATRLVGAPLAAGAPAIVQARVCRQGSARPTVGVAGSIVVQGQQAPPAGTGTVMAPESGGAYVE